MDLEDDRELLEREIARYRTLARTLPDYETAQNIKSLVTKLEERLRQIDELGRLSAACDGPGAHPLPP
jgi:hypothetical protein